MAEQPPKAEPSSRRRFRFSLRAVFVVFVVVALVLGYFLDRRNSAARWEISNAIHQVLLGLANYSAAHGQLPPAVQVDSAGHPLSSWRFRLCPFMMRFRFEYWGGYEPVLDVPWDAPVNEPLADSRTIFSKRPGGDHTETNILAITGPGTAFDDDVPHALEDLPDDLIVLVESRHPGIHWMAPGDLDIRTIRDKLGQPEGICGIVRGGFHVGFADCSVWRLQPDTPFDALEKLLTIESADTVDREEILGPYRLPSD